MPERPIDFDPPGFMIRLSATTAAFESAWIFGLPLPPSAPAAAPLGKQACFFGHLKV